MKYLSFIILSSLMFFSCGEKKDTSKPIEFKNQKEKLSYILGAINAKTLSNSGEASFSQLDKELLIKGFNENLNGNSTEIEYYTVDGKRVPPYGLGSLIVFNGLDEGILNRAGRTIKAAASLEQAAEMYAKEPMPQMVLKSNGTNLTPERITKLLESWKISRSTRSTAFLNADVELQALGFDPAKLQLNEARQYLALEIARASGIPASFVSAETTSMTYSNMTAERKALIDFSLRPILTAIEQRLSAADFCPNGIETRFDIDDFLRGSALERAQVYEILNRIGAMSVEQIQEEEDLIR